MAREESVRLHHEYVGTEHILLGLIREGEGVAATVLRNLSIDVEAIRRTIDETLKKGTAQKTGPDLPYTTRAKKVLELSMSAARELGHEYVGTEHLLIGLMREQQGIAAQVLASLAVSEQAVRAETLRLLGSAQPGEPVPIKVNGKRVAPRSVVVELHFVASPTQRHEFRTVRDAIGFLSRYRESEPPE